MSEVMTWSEWAALDATAMAALVRRGDVTPAELAQQAQQAVAVLNPQLNAVMEVFDDVIENPYKDGMSHEGDFHGVPMLLKDCLSGMKGRLQENGAKFLEGARKLEDDPLTQSWRRAGFNLIGRTSLPAMGSAPVSDGILHGVTRNPWHLDYTPSGSSGGSATAVSAGIVPIASASDGGGSTRSPAGYTGLIGLKPTRGRLPMPDGYSEFSGHIGVEGVLTRTVRDTALAYDTMSQHRPGDAFIPIKPPAGSYCKELDRAPGQRRIALVLDSCGRDGAVDPLVEARIREVAVLLQSLGHEVEEVASREICDWEILWRGADVNWIGRMQFWPQIAAAHGAEINAENCEPVFRHLIAASARYTLQDFMQMQQDNVTYTRQFGRFFERYDLILSPVEAVTASLCGPDSPLSPLHPVNSEDEAIAFIQQMTDNGRFMIAANDAGYPAISVPAGLDSAGVPLGAQFSAAWCSEDLLIQLAAQLERARPDWFDQKPPHHIANSRRAADA